MEAHSKLTPQVPKHIHIVCDDNGRYGGMLDMSFDECVQHMKDSFEPDWPANSVKQMMYYINKNEERQQVLTPEEIDMMNIQMTSNHKEE